MLDKYRQNALAGRKQQQMAVGRGQTAHLPHPAPVCLTLVLCPSLITAWLKTDSSRPGALPTDPLFPLRRYTAAVAAAEGAAAFGPLAGQGPDGAATQGVTLGSLFTEKQSSRRHVQVRPAAAPVGYKGS